MFVCVGGGWGGAGEVRCGGIPLYKQQFAKGQ